MNRPNGITITPMPPTMLTDSADKLRGMIESFKLYGHWHRDDQEFVHALSRLELKLRGEAARREDLGMGETELDTLRRLNSDKAERLDACRKEGLRLLARANGLEAALREILDAPWHPLRKKLFDIARKALEQ